MQTTETQDQLLTVEEVANILRLSKASIYNKINEGEITYVDIGSRKARRIRRSDLDEFIRRSTREASGAREATRS